MAAKAAVSTHLITVDRRQPGGELQPGPALPALRAGGAGGGAQGGVRLLLHQGQAAGGHHQPGLRRAAEKGAAGVMQTVLPCCRCQPLYNLLLLGALARSLPTQNVAHVLTMSAGTAGPNQDAGEPAAAQDAAPAPAVQRHHGAALDQITVPLALSPCSLAPRDHEFPTARCGPDLAACLLCQVREELEDFLKDDDDISKMCLTRKAELSKDGVGELLSTCLCSLSLDPAPAASQHTSLISAPNICARRRVNGQLTSASTRHARPVH